MASYDGIANKIGAKYRQKLGMTHVPRLDLAFTDHEIIDKDAGTARILVAFNPLHGEPTSEMVERFIWSTFEQKVMPKMNTARIYDKDHAVEVLVERSAPTIPFEEVKKRKMAVLIPGKTYVDKEAIWEVRATEDGTKYLVRKSDDNLDEILEERRKYTHASMRTARFSKLHTAGYATTQVGDTVEFYQGTKSMQGKVQALNKDNTVDISAGGTSFKVQRNAIARIVQHSEAYLNERKRMQYDFYAKYLGPELAEKLTNLAPDIQGP